MPKHCQALICCVLKKSARSWKLHCILWKVSTKPSEASFCLNYPNIHHHRIRRSRPTSREWLMEAVHWSSLQWWIAPSMRDPINILVGDFHLHLTSGWLPQRAGGWSCSRLGGPRDFPTSNVCSFYPKEGASIIHKEESLFNFLKNSLGLHLNSLHTQIKI